jgi:prefoldin subunit 5
MRKKSAEPMREYAAEKPSRDPTTAELALQIAALQDAMRDVQKHLDTQFQRIAAIQAQLDHLTAKHGG